VNKIVSVSVMVLVVVASCCIAQNKSWIVGDIEFNGNENISDRMILKRMHLKPVSVVSKGTPFSLIDLISDMSSIGALYRSKGYINTQIKVDSLHYDSSAYKISIAINISEGNLVCINSIDFIGKTFLSRSQLKKIISIKEASPLDSESIAASRKAILDTLISSGYWYADIEFNPLIDSNKYTADFNFFISQGPIIRAGELRCEGLTKVKKIVIERELSFFSDRIFTTDISRQSIRRLYDTGLFSSVSIVPYDTLTVPPTADTLTLPILVNVHESEMILLSGGLGYDSYEKLYVSALIGYKNFFRTGHRVSTQGKLSSALKGAYLSYFYPWILNKPLNGNLTAYIERQNQQTYSGLFNGGSFGLNGNWDWNNYYNARVRLEHTQSIHEKHDSLLFDSLSHKSTLAFGGSLRKDTRAKISDPGTALYASVFTEIAGPFLPRTNQFYKYEIDLRSYLSYKENSISISSAFYSGYVNGYGKDVHIVPQQELFRPGFGTVRPVRGYKENQISPVDTEGNALGGKYPLIVNLIEVRIAFYKWLTVAAFIDAGRVFENITDFSFNALRWSAGPGVVINTPLGLIRVDYGVQLHSSPEGRFLFSFGLPF
jgi:outer membrane protein insertion porin family